MRGYDSRDAGRYELSLTRLDPDDHGSSVRNATRMDSEDRLDGNISRGEEDFFVFDARRGRTYVIETRADLDTVIELRDDSNYQIDYDDDGGQGGASLLRWTAPSSGDYFVVVRGYDSGDLGTYRLLISEDR